MTYLLRMPGRSWCLPLACFLFTTVALSAASSSSSSSSSAASAASASSSSSHDQNNIHHGNTTGDDGSGEVDPGATILSLDDVLAMESAPHLVVKDANGQPCLLATLNATMQVSYRVPEVIVHETYLAMADIQLPEDVQARGVCGENVTHLRLHWGNNTFHVNMTFTKKEADPDQMNATWSMTDIAVAYDLSDKTVFPGASENDVVTVEKHGLSLFSSEVGATYACNRDITTHLGGNAKGVFVSFHEMEIAAFGVTSQDFPSEVHYCSESDENNNDEDILIPLIIACCLSAIVILVVIGYVISRKIQEAREQSEYRPMP